MVRGERIDLLQQVVGLCHGFRFLWTGLVDGEGREAQSLMFSKGIKGTDTAIFAAATLRNKETILNELRMEN